MKYTIADALIKLRPDSSWNLDGSEYSGLEWLDSGATKPTESELNTKVAELDAAEPMRLLREESYGHYTRRRQHDAGTTKVQ